MTTAKPGDGHHWSLLRRLALAASSLPGATRVDRGLLVQFVKFGIVGISNTLLAFLIYMLLLKVFGVYYIASSAIGFSVGAVNGFLLNRRWTFSGHVGDAFTPLRWCLVQGLGLLLNLALVYLFVSGAHLDKLLGQAFATAVVVVITFSANRAWTFRMHPAGHPLAIRVLAQDGQEP